VKRRAALGIGRAFVAVLLCTSKAAFAQTVAVSGSPGSFHVTTAIAGSEPTVISNSTTTYTIVTPTAGNNTYKVTAQLNAAMPAGTTLTATFTAPAGGGSSTGAVALDVTARDMVTGIPKKLNSTQGITYQFAATASAGVIPVSTRTVTLTILQFP
jgi:hypothetical protein